MLISLLYFFVWRPSDGDYESASKNIDVLENSSRTFAIEVASIKRAEHIDSGLSIRLQLLASIYKQTYSRLTSNPAVLNDETVRAMDKRHHETLEKYVGSMNSLIKSIEIYTLVHSTCGSYANDYDSGGSVVAPLLATCIGNLDIGKSSKNESFNSSFLTEYLSLVYEYVESLEKIAKNESDQSTNTKVLLDKIQEIETKELKLQIPSVSQALADLKTTINKQKSAFWR